MATGKLAGVIDIDPRGRRRPAERPAPSAGFIGASPPAASPSAWVGPAKGGGVKPAPPLPSNDLLAARLDRTERDLLEMHQHLIALSSLVETAIRKAFGIDPAGL